MLGMNKAVRGEKLVSSEFLRIARIRDGAEAGQLAYFAQPSGKPPTALPVKELGAGVLVCEGPAHDFPQRNLYRLEADGTLVARIEGTIDGKEQSMEWR